MDIDKFKKLINMFAEGRDTNNPSISYEDDPIGSKVIARLRSYNSQIYTKLAQKLQRAEALSEEISALKDEIKADTKNHIQDLFDSVDVCRTRVVETVSFVFNLTKDPKVTESPKYKNILEELETYLTPELITVLEGIKRKEEMITRTQKSPALSVKPVTIDESVVGNIFSKLKSYIMIWARNYDTRLNILKSKAGMVP